MVVSYAERWSVALSVVFILIYLAVYVCSILESSVTYSVLYHTDVDRMAGTKRYNTYQCRTGHRKGNVTTRAT